MNREAVYHRIKSEYSYFIRKDEVSIRLRVKKNDLQKVEVIYVDKYNFFQGRAPYNYVEMVRFSSDEIFDYYKIEIKFTMSGMGYFFKLYDGNSVLYYGNNIFFTNGEALFDKMFSLPTRPLNDYFEIPEWSKKAIIYQIFPDRFYRGSQFENSDKFDSWNGNINYKSKLGGNLKGIIEKLEYLHGLGINVIYLTPIFRSDSNHKYDIIDYMEIDSEFGTKEDFKLLVERSHDLGIKVVLDAVFNHCSHDFFAFKDLLENQEKSQYKDWFIYEKTPVKLEKPPKYEAYSYYPHMPKLNQANEETTEYFISVAEYWIKEFNIDGWRFDVADDVSHSFWRELRKRVKKIKPEVLLIGEVWYNSSPWLEGDQFDTVMNYPFFYAVLDYIAFQKTSDEDFKNSLSKIFSYYKEQPYHVLWNLLGSHDVPRFMTHVGGDIKKFRLGVILLFTLPGVPMVYYGDEIPMKGGADPDNRRGMKWHRIKDSDETFLFFKKLVKIRRENEPLNGGDLEFRIYDDGIFAFRRKLNNNFVDIYINNSDEVRRIKIYSEKRSLLRDDIINEYIELYPKSGDIIVSA